MPRSEYRVGRIGKPNTGSVNRSVTAPGVKSHEVWSGSPSIISTCTASAGNSLGTGGGTGGAGGLAAGAFVAGAAAWVVALMSYHWYPFDFTMAPDRVTLGMHELLSVPFSSYYFGCEFHAFTEMSRKALLALPLGVLLGLSSPSVGKHRERTRSLFLAATGFCVLVGIEAGQVFLPPRMPDLTDALIGEIGLLAGLWLSSRFSREKEAPALVGATHPSA